MAGGQLPASGEEMVAATLTVGESRAEMALGIVGVFTAFLVILSPWSKFSSIRRTQQVGETKAYPVMFNSAIWVIFAIPAIHKLLHHQHPGLTDYLGVPLLIANCAGVVVELWYVYVFIRFAVGQRSVPVIILVVVILASCAVLGLLLGLKCSRTFVGYIAMFSGAAMYAIPVYGTCVAYKANDVSEISIFQASASLANGIVWTAYSCIGRVRAFVFVPNLTAVVCAGGQLVARGCLKRKIARIAAEQAEAQARAERARDLESGGGNVGGGAGSSGEAQRRGAELAEAEGRGAPQGPELRAVDGGDGAGNGGGGAGLGRAVQDLESGAAGGGRAAAGSSGDVQMTQQVAAITGGCGDAQGTGGAGANDDDILLADENAVPVLDAGHGRNNIVENQGQEGDDDSNNNNAGSNVDDGGGAAVEKSGEDEDSAEAE